MFNQSRKPMAARAVLALLLALFCSSAVLADSMVIQTLKWEGPSLNSSWNGESGTAYYNHTVLAHPPTSLFNILALSSFGALFSVDISMGVRMESEKYDSSGTLGSIRRPDPAPISGLISDITRSCTYWDEATSGTFDINWWLCTASRQENLGPFIAGRYYFTSLIAAEISLIGEFPLVDDIPALASEANLPVEEQIDFLCENGQQWDHLQQRCVDPDASDDSEEIPCPDPERMERDADGNCECKSPWLPLPPSEGQSELQCVDRDELDQWVEDNLGRNLDDGAEVTVERTRVSWEMTICQEIRRVDIDGGVRIFYECETWIIDITISLKRAIEHDGLDWEPSSHDPTPWLPIEDPPYIDLEAIFGECYEVDGVPVTECWDEEDHDVVVDRPDLQIAFDGADAVGAGAAVGDPLWVRFRVHNAGEVTAVNSEYEVTYTLPSYDQRIQRGFIGSLAPGTSRQFEVGSVENIAQPFTLEPGLYRVKLEADHLGEIAEHSESNNSTQRTKVIEEHVPSGLDLRAGPIDFDLSNPVVGQTITASFSIRNVGAQITPATEAEVLAQQSNGQATLGFLNVPSLAPGASADFDESISLVSAGALVIGVEADSGHWLTETDEANNSRTNSVQVNSGDEPCLPCTAGSPNHVGARICADPNEGQPHDGSEWQCFGVRIDGSSCVSDGNHPNGWDWVGDRCPDPDTLCLGQLHPDNCGNPGICPGSLPCP